MTDATNDGTNDSAVGVDDLLAMLASPDPSVRDDTALPELAGRIESGALDRGLVELGGRLVAMFDDPAAQARTFSALALGVVIDRDTVAGVVGAADVARWRQGFLDWWLSETDLRGWDPDLGWLHAVAHGADALLAFGRSAHSDAGTLAGLLEAAARRVLSTEEVFDAAEDDRVAYAVFGTLARPELTSTAATAWVEPVVARLSAVPSGPVPPFAVNTVHTVTALSLMVERGCRLPGSDAVVAVPHRAAVLEALAGVYRVAWSPLG